MSLFYRQIIISYIGLTVCKLNARLARWSLYLQILKFQVQYQKGKENRNPDDFSQKPDLGQLYCPHEGGGNVMK